MGLIGNDDTDDRKPLFRAWAKSQRDKAMEDKDIWDRVEMVRLSTSGEWIIVEGSECSGLIKTQSSGGKRFWEELQSFDGRGKALIMVQSRNKWGFDIEIDPKEVGYWEQDKSSKVVLYGKHPSQTATCMEGITWGKVKEPALDIREPKVSTRKTKNGVITVEEVDDSLSDAH